MGLITFAHCLTLLLVTGKMFGLVQLSWLAVLTPSIIVAGLVFFMASAVAILTYYGLEKGKITLEEIK